MNIEMTELIALRNKANANAYDGEGELSEQPLVFTAAEMTTALNAFDEALTRNSNQTRLIQDYQRQIDTMGQELVELARVLIKFNRLITP